MQGNFETLYWVGPPALSITACTRHQMVQCFSDALFHSGKKASFRWAIVGYEVLLVEFSNVPQIALSGGFKSGLEDGLKLAGQKHAKLLLQNVLILLPVMAKFYFGFPHNCLWNYCHRLHTTFHFPGNFFQRNCMI